MVIADWRNLFGQGDFPFYIVPFFGPHSITPTDDGWADMRESQAIRSFHRSQFVSRGHYRHW